MIAAVIGDIAIAMPETSGMSARRIHQYGVSRPTRENTAKPTAMSTIPKPTTRFAPNRALSLGVSGATMIMIGAIGSNRTAADSGE